MNSRTNIRIRDFLILKVLSRYKNPLLAHIALTTAIPLSIDVESVGARELDCFNERGTLSDCVSQWTTDSVAGEIRHPPSLLEFAEFTNFLGQYNFTSIRSFLIELVHLQEP